MPLLNADVDKIIMYGYYDTYFVKEINGVKIMRVNEDGSCVFFKQGQCEVYNDRPERCRLYPWSVDDHGKACLDDGCPYSGQIPDSAEMRRRMERFAMQLDKEIMGRRKTGNFY